ncbi:hypothetical protein GCM10010274_43290 [Streptomyces lavendofoliae]|uniref:Uncharacterized protein n=1 Tax=Streptomyces lavendofoliae TaxID=67314 RepID=A0A918M5C0_9ACTN|nr:hypothetical protein GCM10010274_43290 [Streptomyces lavendofoliae]
MRADGKVPGPAHSLTDVVEFLGRAVREVPAYEGGTLPADRAEGRWPGGPYGWVRVQVQPPR